MGNEYGDIELPATVPVMVLGGATLFPKTLLPLFIFEPRYRAMLEDALSSERMLAIAQPLRDGEERLHSVGGVGLIRACVRKEDGTSHLILQGVRRVFFRDWPQLVPFRIAAVEPFGTVQEESQDQRQARLVHLQVILERGGLPLPKEVSEQFSRIDDPDVLTDIAASALLKKPEDRQAVLEEAGNVARQELFLKLLRQSLA